MPRHQRKKSKTGFYHAIIRGNEKRNVFLDEEDKYRFIETLYDKKQNQSFYLHAFCLMNNHVHLMVSEGNDDISVLMKRINVSYVSYFNHKYKRSGHLLQDRFRSEAVEDDRYLISLARYIHQNPVKAKMVKSPEEYKWSSYNAYIKEKDYFQKILDQGIILRMFSDDVKEAKIQFAKYMNIDSEDIYLDLPQNEVMDEEEAKALLRKMLIAEQVNDHTLMPDNLIVEFKQVSGLSLRKIAEITSLDKSKISRILNKLKTC